MGILYKYMLVAILSILILIVPVTAAWNYYKVINDPVGDVRYGGENFTDILEMDYAFNDTHVSINFTFNGNIPQTSSVGLLYDVYFDTDNNASTGYNVTVQDAYGNNITFGAEYKAELLITSLGRGDVVLSKYNPDTGDWESVLIPYSQVNGNKLDMIISKSGFDHDLGNNVTIVGLTRNPSNIYDWTDASEYDNPLPIPEVWLIAFASIAAAAVVIGLKRKSISRMLHIQTI